MGTPHGVSPQDDDTLTEIPSIVIQPGTRRRGGCGWRTRGTQRGRRSCRSLVQKLKHTNAPTYRMSFPRGRLSCGGRACGGWRHANVSLMVRYEELRVTTGTLHGQELTTRIVGIHIVSPNVYSVQTRTRPSPMLLNACGQPEANECSANGSIIRIDLALDSDLAELGS